MDLITNMENLFPLSGGGINVGATGAKAGGAQQAFGDGIFQSLLSTAMNQDLMAEEDQNQPKETITSSGLLDMMQGMMLVKLLDTLNLQDVKEGRSQSLNAQLAEADIGSDALKEIMNQAELMGSLKSTQESLSKSMPDMSIDAKLGIKLQEASVGPAAQIQDAFTGPAAQTGMDSGTLTGKRAELTGILKSTQESLSKGMPDMSIDAKLGVKLQEASSGMAAQIQEASAGQATQIQRASISQATQSQRASAGQATQSQDASAVQSDQRQDAAALQPAQGGFSGTRAGTMPQAFEAQRGIALSGSAENPEIEEGKSKAGGEAVLGGGEIQGAKSEGISGAVQKSAAPEAYSQITREILPRLEQKGPMEFKMQLEPENLGKIDISLRMNEGKLVIDIMSASLTTHTLLLSQVDKLAASLGLHNVQIETVNVNQNHTVASIENQVSGESQSRMDQGGDEQRERFFEQERQRLQSEAISRQRDMAEISTVLQKMRYEAGRMNYVI